jgi:biotin carboxyl carrier protein
MAKVTIGGRDYEVEVRGDVVVVDGHEYPVKIREDQGYLTVTAGGAPYRVQLPPADQRETGMGVQVDYRPFTVAWSGRLGGAAPREPRAAASGPAVPRAGAKGGISAQIAGRVIAVRVKPGDAVKAGDVLLLLEAMKMENEIKSPRDGTVKEVLVTEGARVAEGETLVVVD